VANPATEWLFARLERGSATPQDLLDEALPLGISKNDLRIARDACRVVEETRIPEAGGKKYVVWTLPPAIGNQFRPGYDPRRVVKSTALVKKAPSGLEDAPSTSLSDEKRRDPKRAVEVARDKIRRRAPRYAAYLDELARKASSDAEKCPTCGRGTPRSEDLRLRAVIAALDRGGVVAPKAEGTDGAPSGPVIVFPPGTKMAIIAETGPSEVVDAVRITRASDFEAPSA